MVLGLVLLIAAIAVPSFATVVADSQADFSSDAGTGQGYNGWYYKVITLGTGGMTQMDAVNNWELAGNPFWVSVSQAPWTNTYIGIGKTLMRGYVDNVWAPAREWVAPSAVGVVKISGTFARAAAGTKNQRFFINVNGTPIYTLDVSATDVTTHAYEAVATLGAGDAVTFVFNPDSSANYTQPPMGPNDLNANMTATIETITGASLTASVTLENYYGDLSLLPIRVTLVRDGDGSITKTITPSAYTTAVAFTDVPAGNYTIRAEAAKFLSRVVNVPVAEGSNGTVEISLPNGDIDGSCEVDWDDYNYVVNSFGMLGD